MISAFGIDHGEISKRSKLSGRQKLGVAAGTAAAGAATYGAGYGYGKTIARLGEKRKAKKVGQ